jgi:hypothetical protein
VQYYRNPLTFPYLLGSTLLFLPLLYAPVTFPALNRSAAWVAFIIVFGYLGLSTALWMRSAFHLHWYVGPDSLRSVQTVRSGTITHDFPNSDFVSIDAHGPFVVVRRASGEQHVWPRWLRRKRKTFRWQLCEGRLQLIAAAAGACSQKV